jgi:glucose/arabinose dehydrogenase
VSRLRGVLAGLALTATALLSGCALGAPPPDQNGQPPTFPTPTAASPSATDGGDSTATVLAAKLPQPWAIAFLPDGSALVSERKTGRIVRIGEPQTAAGGLTVTPFAQVPGVNAAGDGGLLGIAVSPKYQADHRVYAYYSTATDNRIAVLTTGGTPNVILKGIPHGLTDNGGGLGFGPDGFLYASTGDAGRATGGTKAPSQDPASLGGKILRMTTAGKPAPGNPTANSLVYARGFHNVEGLAWDHQKYLYVVDAAAAEDRLDVVVAGRNYGWPSADPKSVTQPIQTFPLDQSTCSGIAVLDGAVAVACPTGKRLWLAELNANATTFGAPATALTNTYGRLRAIAAASDGTLWVGTSNTDGHGTAGATDDQILRIVLASEGAGQT